MLPPTLAGVPIGALIAIYLPSKAFEPLFGAIFLAMAGVLMIDPKRLTESRPPSPRAQRWVVPIFFGIGVYVGFIQAGMGILLLLGMSLLRSGDLVAANAIKNLIGFTVTLLALSVFVFYGMIAWGPALTMASGNALGGIVGAKLALRKGNRLVMALLVVVMIATGLKLLWPWVKL